MINSHALPPAELLRNKMYTRLIYLGDLIIIRKVALVVKEKLQIFIELCYYNEKNSFYLY